MKARSSSPLPFSSRVRRRVQSIFGRRQPKFHNFGAEYDDDLRATYRGASADIFFANDGPIIHKWLHYFAIYDQVLASYVGSSVKMLEIGVSKGGSLGLWRKFLGSDAVIFGVDVDLNCSRHDGEFASVRIGSQDDARFLRTVVAEMGGIDVVLDDGSHIARHQRASFDVLFPLLNEGGIYIIEYMHTSYWPPFEGGLNKSGTAIEFLKGKIDEMHAHYRVEGLNKAECMPDIESIQFFDSIAVVKKRKQLPRFHMQVPSPNVSP